MTDGNALIAEACDHWNSWATFRKNRNRNKDYVFGRQWNDMIEVNGVRMTEYDFIVSEGNMPLKNNLIRRIVRNVLGVFRRKLPELLKGKDKRINAIAESSSMTELYARTMEEFLISGLAVHRKGIRPGYGPFGLHTEMVSPSSFFMSRDARDVRGLDMETVGQFHDVGFHEWCEAFVKGRNDFEEAKRIFTGRKKRKVIEIWRHEMRERSLCHDRINGLLLKTEISSKEGKRKPIPSSRWILDDVWRYYFIDESGKVLQEGDSPYLHGAHPFVVKAYPFLDGEIQSLVGDIIDQQRYTNRLITYMYGVWVFLKNTLYLQLN